MIGEKSWESQSLGFGSGFDLTQGILGQGLDGYAGTSRVGSKVLCVDCVESGKVAHIRQKTGGLEDLLCAAAGSFQSGDHVLATLLGLCCNACGHFTGGRVNRQLAGSVNSIADNETLRIGTDGTGSVLGIDLFHNSFLLCKLSFLR